MQKRKEASASSDGSDPRTSSPSLKHQKTNLSSSAKIPVKPKSVSGAPGKNGMEDVLKTMEVDRIYRYPGVKDDLLSLDEFAFKEWDFSLPTLCPGRPFDRFKSTLPGDEDPSDATKNVNLNGSFTLAEFRKRFLAELPFLEDIDWTNVILAGGAVAAFINPEQKSSSEGYAFGDLDFFLYGLKDQDQATERAMRLLEEIGEACENHPGNRMRRASGRQGEAQANYVRSFGAISAPLQNGDTAQVVLRLYPTESEILHGFDLGSCAVGWNGEKVMMTSLGAFCLSRRVNVVDTTRRSTSYEPRLVKYLQRGFNIITPHLDMSKIPEKGTCQPDVMDSDGEDIIHEEKRKKKPRVDLYNMRFMVEKRVGNRIKIPQTFHGIDIQHPMMGTRKTDYSGDCTHAIGWQNLKAMMYASKVGEVAEKGGKGGKGEKGEKVEWKLDDQFPLGWCYPVDECKLRDVEKLPYDDIKDSLIRKYKGLWKTYKFSNMRADERVGSLSCSFVKYICCIPRDQLAAGLQKEDWVKFGKDVLEKQINMIHEIFASLCRQTESIIWRTADPGSQLTGSFNPIIADEKDWYKGFYKN